MVFDEIKYWLKENSLAVGLIGLFIVLIPLFLWLKPDTEEEIETNVVTLAEKYKVYESELNKNFAIMNIQVDNELNPKRPSYKIDLYLKSPFIDEATYETQLNMFTEMFIWKYSKPEKDINVSALKIDVYDRKMLYDRKKLQRDRASYQLIEVDKKDEQGLKDYERAENGNEFLYNYSVANKQVPDYSKYKLISQFKEVSNMKSKENIPLTDTELKFLLKVFEYNAFMQDNLDNESGFRTLMFWEYGIKTIGLDVGFESLLVYKEAYKSFEDLKNRASNYYNYNDNFYPNNTKFGKSEYYNNLVVENPKLAYYLATNNIAKTTLEAKKKLIKIERKSDSFEENTTPYIDMFVNDAKKKLLEANIDDSQENINKYINSNGNMQDFIKDNNLKPNKDLERVKKAQEKEYNVEPKENNDETKKSDVNVDGKNNDFSDENVE